MVLQHNHLRRIQTRAGFTLMEMLVVVAIIVALAGIGGFFLFGQLMNSREGVAAAKIRNLSAATEIWTNNNGQFPPNLEALLVVDPAGRPPILKSQDQLLDPWNNHFVYDPAGQNNNGLQPDIYCTTPNGKVIGNWPQMQVQQ